MMQMRIGQALRTAALAVCLGALLPLAGSAQSPKRAVVAQPPPSALVEQPNAQRVRQELWNLLGHYPPTLREVLGIDPNLLNNESYLAPYPALVSFLNAHPEVTRDSSFYVGGRFSFRPQQDPATQALDMWKNVFAGIAVFAGFGMAIGLLVWLIRTVVDHRRWSRLTKVQTDVHTKLLDRFGSNEDLLAYIQSPAGAKFLQSAPISLYPASRTAGAPLGRILLSVQGGVVLIAAGIGLQFVSGQVVEASQPLHVLGILALALGLGFVVSAIISYGISRRLGLIEPASPAPRNESQGA
ncbi:MAG: hypothetical protein ABSC23_04890 [Bryobacteraceae bacterium]|jgi:hypothetical protein